jgi:hypothetical protein
LVRQRNSDAGRNLKLTFATRNGDATRITSKRDRQPSLSFVDERIAFVNKRFVDERFVARSAGFGGESGRNDATEALLEQFRPLLRSRMHALWTQLRAELTMTEWADVEAQVTLMFLTRLHAFDPGVGVYFPYYIERMLDFDGRAWVRQQRRGQAMPFSQIGLGAGEDELDELMPNAFVDESSESYSSLDLRAALDELGEAHRIVVWNCCVLGKTESAVALELGLSRSTVRNRLDVALGILRQKLDSSERGTRTGRARSGAKDGNAHSPFTQFWNYIFAMAKDEKRPDLVGVGAGRPVLLQGTFDFPATGLHDPQMLSPKLRYTVPVGHVAGVRYMRVGVMCETMSVISTVVNGLPHRLVPVAANSTAYTPFAIVEPIVAGSQIEIWIASTSPGTAIVDAGILQMPA